jgi:hypothetical protein
MVAACGGGEMSLTEYVDDLNAISEWAIPRGEALQAEYAQLSEPTLEDLTRMLEAGAALFAETNEAAAALRPPDQVVELHRLIFDWQSTMIPISDALADRAAAATDWGQVLESAEAEAYYVALAGGKTVCDEYQDRLDATTERGAFADTPWVPAELKEVVEAFLACELFTENPEDALRPPTSTAP